MGVGVAPGGGVRRERLEGLIIPVWKPVGMSSFAVVYRIRRLTGIKRIGHGGTLDPFAEGLLVIGIGRTATRRLSGYLKMDKEYLARVSLGIVTDTDDPTGRVLRIEQFNPFTCAEIETVLARFQGEIMQVPPRFSALKVDGRRMYKSARKGIEPPRTARPVTIKEIELTALHGDGFEMRVVCSSGTYIRALGFDIGKELGCGAYVSRLQRTRIGTFTGEDAIALERFDIDRALAIGNKLSITTINPTESTNGSD